MTSPAFVYRTPDATFTAPCMPSIVATEQFLIEMIGSTNQQPVTRSLADHLTVLFQALLTDASTQTMDVQISVLYQYDLNPQAGSAALPVTVPVLMQPPLAVTWSGTPPAGGISLQQMIADLSAAITSWFSTNQPSLDGGALLFSLAIMSNLTLQPMPLLRFTDLQLDLQYVQPALTGAVRLALAR
jgi:hypothetical protein